MTEHFFSQEHLLKELQRYVLICTPETTRWNTALINYEFNIVIERQPPRYRDPVVESCLVKMIAFMHKRGIPPRVMYTRYRHPLLMQCRREVWAYLREVGCSYPTIGAACGFGHASIIEGLQLYVPTYELLNPVRAEVCA